MKRAITFCTALALALTSLGVTSRPAQANDELVGQLLLGAVTAGILYQTLREQEKDEKRRETRKATATPTVRETYRDTYRGEYDRGGAYYRDDKGWHKDKGWNKNKGGPKWKAREKHAACRQMLPTRRGDVQFIADRCLDHPRAKPRVPQNCLRDRWVDGRWKQVYSRKCLARYGEVR